MCSSGNRTSSVRPGGNYRSIWRTESGWQKNLLGGRGGRVFCLVDVTDFMDFKSSSSRWKLLALSGFEVEFADKECYTISAVFRTDDFRSQRNSAAEWSRNFLTVNKCKWLRTGSKWDQCISVSLSWIFEFGGNLFSSLCDFFECLKYFCRTIDQPSILTCIWFTATRIDLQFCFLDIQAAHLCFMCIGFIQVYI